MGSSWWVVALGLGAGCSGRGGGGTPGSDGGGSLVDSDLNEAGFVIDARSFDAPSTIDAPPPAIDAPPMVGPCSSAATIPANDQVWTIQHGGQARTFHVHLPTGYGAPPMPTPTPVVLNFHGWGGTAAQQAQMTRMYAAANTNGFIAVHPNGTGAMQAWNGGACCPPNAAVTTDDVGFTAAILDEVSARLCVNRRRVYATGFSNGAFMAYRLACELSNRIAAIVPVAGVLGIAACNPARAVPVGHFHGMLDTYVPHDGSPSVVGATFSSVPGTINVFGVRNGCSGAPQAFLTSGDTTCYRYSNGCTSNAEVRICQSSSASHSWPGADPNAMPGETTTQAIDATTAMWLFFSMYQLP